MIDAGHDVALVVTRPDTRRGRRGTPSPSPVKAAALDAGLVVSEDPADVVATGVELGVVVAYGRLIRPPVLAAVPMVNLHFSLLPRWRGAAPVERAVLAGDPTTGVCLMALEEGLDTGAVYRRHEVAIGPDETAEGLRLRLAEVGTASLVEALGHGLGPAAPQTGTPTYAAKLTPEDRRLDWDRSAVELDRVVRIGRAWTTWRGRRLLVLEAAPLDPDRATVPVPGSPVQWSPAGSLGPPVPGATAAIQAGALGTISPGAFGSSGPGGAPTIGTGDGGALVLRVVQPEGRGRLNAVEWARGARPGDDERLGAP